MRTERKIRILEKLAGVGFVGQALGTAYKGVKKLTGPNPNQGQIDAQRKRGLKQPSVSSKLGRAFAKGVSKINKFTGVNIARDRNKNYSAMNNKGSGPTRKSLQAKRLSPAGPTRWLPATKSPTKPRTSVAGL